MNRQCFNICYNFVDYVHHKFTYEIHPIVLNDKYSFVEEPIIGYIDFDFKHELIRHLVVQ